MGGADHLVSVIIPVYNSEEYLAQAIESVLAQTYRPTELIVVDDGSDDQSSAIARSYREVSYLCQDNQGPPTARNRGLAAARGKFISFIDHDDVWLPGKLELQIGVLLGHPHVGFTICRVENFLDTRFSLPPAARTIALMKEQISLNTLVVRRGVFDRVGSFDPAYFIGHDLDWVARAMDMGVDMTILPEVLVRRRIHATNLSYDVETRRKDVFRLLKASIDRQRWGGSGL